MKKIVLSALLMFVALTPVYAGDDSYPFTRPENARRTAGTWFLGGGPVYQDDLGISVVAAYQFTNKITILFGPTYVPLSQHDNTISIIHKFRDGERTSIWNITHPAPERDEWGGQFMILIPLGQ